MMRRKGIKQGAISKALGSQKAFFTEIMKGYYLPRPDAMEAIRKLTDMLDVCWDRRELNITDLEPFNALAITRRRIPAYFVMADFCKASGIAASTQSLIEKGEKEPTSGQIKKYKELLNFDFKKEK
jgi:transcriptional regulator with XRE-family HTH domain